MVKVRGDPGLVRTLVLRESDVAVDPHHRTAIWSRVRNKMAIDLLQAGREVGDKSQEWILHLRLITFFVGHEPIAIVVGFKIFQEAERGPREITISCYLAHRHSYLQSSVGSLLPSWLRRDKLPGRPGWYALVVRHLRHV